MRTVQRGEVIAGKYVIQGIIGRGGVGIIAAARHVTLKQLVALKFLRPEIEGDPEVTRRFVREAQAAAQIRSEHVTRVMDAGTLEDGTVFLVFEHLTGRDLARVLREDGPLAIEDAVDYLTQACEAIAEAHALGIIHRDLKPANLFLTRAPDGAPFVKVLDFGLSKFNQSALSALTAENLVIGSPHFMSPEQMRSSRDADARSDIWALGVVLFGLLTGRVPFEGQFLPEVCAAILGGKPLSLLELRPDAPPELEAVILRCLRSKPEERIQSVAELAEALRPFTPAHGQARAARIARVADGAKLALATSTDTAAHAVASTPLERQSEANGSEQLAPARKAVQHGPSPVSWSISVGRALSRDALGEPRSGAQRESLTPSKSTRPPTAARLAAPSAARGASGAPPRRRWLLVPAAAVSLLVGAAGAFWIGPPAPSRQPPSSHESELSPTSPAASVAAPAPTASDLSVSLSALRTAAVPSQAPLVVAASSEPSPPVASASKPPLARPANPRNVAPIGNVARSVTQVRRPPARSVASGKPARSPQDEELILGLPH